MFVARRNTLLFFCLSLLGTMTTASAVDLGTATHQQIPGDFNGDGRIDALLQPLEAKGHGAIVLRDGTGQLRVVAQGWNPGYLGLDWSAFDSSISIADLNGDGLDDVLVQPMQAGGKASVLVTGPTAQLLRVAQVIPADYLGLDWSAPAHQAIPGDFDGDRRKELLLQAMNPGDEGAIVHADAAGRLMAVTQAFADGYLGRRWNATDVQLYVGDFNGDTRQDLLLQVRSSAPAAAESAYALLLADGDGRFTRINETWNLHDLGADWDPATHKIIIEDANGDGIMDITVRSLNPNGTNYSFTGNAEGAFTHPAAKWKGPKSAAEALKTKSKSSESPGTGLSINVPTTKPVSHFIGAPGDPETDPVIPHGGFGQGQAPAMDTPGTLEGSAGVSGGTASYTLPIVIPPGRAGMQPDISLNYSSRGGNGSLGMGWSIGGLSSISRCATTVAQDGHTRNVSFDHGDGFCLDGQRLILDSGTYAQNGSVYRTELESFARVELTGDANAASSSFVVRYKNGRVAHYTVPFVPTGTAAPLSWQIGWERDPANNAITYSYDQSVPGEVLIQQINYTGQVVSGNPTTGTRSINFAYETRADMGSSFIDGAESTQTRRLDSISTWQNNSVARTYQLDYKTSPATGRSLLTSVLGCSYTTGQGHCLLQPTRFGWQGTPQTYSLSPYLVQGYDAGSSSISLNDLRTTIMAGGDYDGDGRRELIYTVNQTSSSVTTHILFVDGAGNVVHDEDITSLLNNVPDALDTTDKDINNDGAADLITNHNGTLAVLSWNGAGFTETDTDVTLDDITVPGYPTFHNSYTKVADMNGDGLNDLVTFEKDNSGDYRLFVHYNLNPRTLHFSARHSLVDVTAIQGPSGPNCANSVTPAEPAGDMNGDGIPDFFLMCGALTEGSNTYFDYILLSNEDASGTVTFSVESEGTFGIPDSSILIDDQHFFMDINGDGLPDLVFVDQFPSNFNGSHASLHWFYQLNTGNGLTAAVDTHVVDGRLAQGDRADPAQPGKDVGKINTLQADIDNDGVDELIFPQTRLASYCPKLWVKLADSSMSDRYDCAGVNNPDFANMQTVADLAPGFDHSIFSYASLKFVMQADGTYTVVENDNTGIVAQAGFATVGDIQGDGLTDLISPFTRGFADSEWQGPNDASFVDCPRYANGCGMEVSSSVYTDPSHDPDGTRKDSAPDMLQSATDGLGMTSSWDYYPLSSTLLGFYSAPSITDADRYAGDDYFYFTSSMYAVGTFKESDGIGGNLTHNYHYGQAIYNSQGRGFQGFYSVVDDNLANGSRSVALFHQRFPLSGQLIENWIAPIDNNIHNFTNPQYDSASIVDTKYTTGCYVGVGNALAVDNIACTPILDANTFWAFIKHSDDYKYDLNSHDQISLKKMDANYDKYGNYTGGLTDVTDAYGNSHEDVTQTYQPADPSSSWWVNRLATKTINNRVSYVTDDQSNPSLSVETDYTFDDATRELQVQIELPNDLAHKRITTYDFDAYGNVTAETLSGGQGSTAIAARTTTTIYSSDSGNEGYFPIQVKNALNQITYMTADPFTGQSATVTDISGVTVVYAYDPLGRKTSTQVTGPISQPAETVSYLSCDSSCPSLSQYYAVTERQGYPSHTVYLDILNRPVRTVTEGFQAGSLIVQDTSYYSAGQVKQDSEPYFNGDVACQNTNTYETNILMRLSVRLTCAGIKTEYTYTDLVTDITTKPQDNANQARTDEQVHDSTGKLLQITNGLTSGTPTESITTFRYDAHGNPVYIRDAKGNAIVTTFNILDQKEEVNDPDMGHWSYRYDVLGNLKTQIDAKQQGTNDSTVMTYDLLNRMLTKSQPESTTPTSWCYDDPSCAATAPGPNVGHLYRVTQAPRGSETIGYQEIYGYDADGRVSNLRSTIDGVNYDTSTTYDAYGRVDTVTYPASVTDVPPVANAGVDQSLVVGGTVNLNGAASTDDDAAPQALRYKWEQTGGPAVSLSNTTAASPTFTASQVAIYTFKLTVDDGLISATDTVNVTAKPGVPGTLGLNETISTDGIFTVHWGTSTGATYYKLYQDSGSGFTLLSPTYTASPVQFGDMGSRTANIDYTYKVQGCAMGAANTGEVCGDYSNTDDVTVVFQPLIPASLSYSVNLDGSVNVTWGDSPQSVVDSYTAELGEMGGSQVLWVDGSCSTDGTQNSCTITNTPAGGGFFYVGVIACNAAGCSPVKQSAGTIHDSVTSPPTLSGPASTTTGSAVLTWTSVSGAPNYRLFAATKSLSTGTWGSYSQIYSGANLTRTVTLGSSAAAARYYVMACVSGSSSNCTDKSNTKTVNYAVPGQPSLSGPATTTDGNVHLSWTTPTGATSFKLSVRYSARGSNGALGASTQLYSGANVAYNDSFGYGIALAEYTVVACNQAGCGTGDSIDVTYPATGGGGGGGGNLAVPAPPKHHPLPGNGPHAQPAPADTTATGAVHANGMAFAMPQLSSMNLSASVVPPSQGIGSLDDRTEPVRPLYAQPVYLAYAGVQHEPVTSTAVAARVSIRYLYTSPAGYLQKVVDGVNSSRVYWTLNSMNERAQILEEQFGAGALVTDHQYEPTTGYETDINSTYNSASVQALHYDWWHNGNLKLRSAVVPLPGGGTASLSEQTGYDVLNRVISAQVTNGAGLQPANIYAYDEVGDIKQRVAVINGTATTYDYIYGGTGQPVHAVTGLSIAGVSAGSYAYDTDGNMTCRDTAGSSCIPGSSGNISWNSDNLPVQISQGTNGSAFGYAPDKHRYRQVTSAGSTVTETTLYAGGLEIVTDSTGTQFRHTMTAYGKSVVLDTFTNDTAHANKPVETPHYLLPDHLGSVDTIVGMDGSIQPQQSFDTFGQRRDPTTWMAPVDPTYVANTRNVTHRGYTGHEELDNVALIHMNGRIYDPSLGRFLSVDPVFQFPANGQSLNPYSYVLNNPLSFTDPSGHFIPVIIGIAVLAGEIYNAYEDVNSTVEAVKTVTDEHATTTQKVIAVATAASNFVDPTPGHLLAKGAKELKVVRGAAEATERMVTRDAAKAAEQSETKAVMPNGGETATAKTAEKPKSTSEINTPTDTGKVTPKDLRDPKAIKSQRDAVLSKNGGKCEYCGERDSSQVDHIVPVKKFADDVNAGKTTRAQAKKDANATGNLAGACGSKGGCNQQKGAKQLSATPGQGKYVPPNPSPEIKNKLGSECIPTQNNICPP
jgi:RHS repeat-associated protein